MTQLFGKTLGKSCKTLAFAGTALAAILTAPHAYAQSADGEDARELGPIIVTGSRIRQNPLDAVSPVQNLSSEDVDRTGLTATGDILARLPITGSAINTTNNSSGNLGFPPDGSGIGAGASQVDLRNLGATRTLVLVDGKRWINGSSASGVPGSVDLNTIPTGMIERVEILQDGASPIYGSDAIAGVVNIITRDDFEGMRASAYYGAYGDGDGETEQYDFSLGVSDTKSRILFDVSYVRQQEVEAGDREISEFPIAGIGRCLATCSSGTPQGRLVFTDPNTGDVVDITLNDGVANTGPGGLPVYDPLNPGTAGDFHNFTVDDRFNFQPFNFIQTPNERLNLFTKAEFDVFDNVTLGLMASYTNRKSVNRAAPEPLFIGPDAGNGNIMDTVGIDVTNPFNPFGFSLDANSLIFAGRRPIEAGPRLFKQNVDTWYVGSTLEGDFQVADSDVYWDVNVSWGQAQANQRKDGAFNAARLKRALGPIDLCIDAATGASIDGCVPFNYLGGQGPDGSGSITPEMLNFVTFIQKDESQQELLDITANLSGEAFELPGGKLGYAIGFEHRELDGFFVPDAVVTAGETAGVPSSPTSGGISSDEVYLEVNAPLLADLPLVKKFEINAAVRTSDYDLFGTNTVYKIGGNWRITDDLLLRANYSEGFRAPGIGELFNTGSRFDATIDDPCSDLLGLDPGGTGTAADAATIANCGALGVPTDGSYVQFGAQIGVQTGGNENLQPEESENITVGVVYDPAWVQGLMGTESMVIEANYYDIELTGAISAADSQTKLSQCVATLDPVTCSGIARTPTGVINGFANQLQNIGGIETSGFDWSIRTQMQETRWGTFSFLSLNSYLIDYTEIQPTATGTTRISREGTELGSPERGFNQFKSTFIIDWTQGDWSASATTRYLDAITENCPGAVVALAPQLCSDATGGTNEIDAVFYADLQGTWSPSDRFLESDMTLSLGINNLFDEDTPFCFSCDLNSFDGTLYPIPGQFLYAKIAFRR